MTYNGPSSGSLTIIKRDNATSGITVAISPPSADVGSDGDFAFDPNTNTLWGPKDSTQASPWANTGAGAGQGLRNRGNWSSTGTYYANDVVFNTLDNQQYLCVKAINFSTQAPWVAQNYEPGSFVTYGGFLYIAVVNPTSSGVPGSSAAWVRYSLDAELSYQGYSAFGNFIRIPPALAVNAYFDGISKTTTWTIPQRSLLAGDQPLNPSNVYISGSGNPLANYLVDSKAIENSASLNLSRDVNDLSAQSNLNTGAGTSVEIKNSGVTTAKIADAAITNIKLDKTAGSQAVSTGAIRDLAVTTAKLADNSVTSAKIAVAGISPASVTGTAVITTDPRLSDSRTPSGSAGGDLTGTYPNPTLAGSIPDSKLSTISTAGKVSNSATTATSANTASAIVARDSSGNTNVNKINIAAASSTWSANDAVTKTYVDSISAGMNWHDACDYATTTVLPNSPNYIDGTTDASNGLGIGAYLQATVNATLLVDGNTTWTVGQRILVKDQSDAKQNGIYTVSSAGSGSSLWKLIRATDTDNSIAGQVKAGDSVFIISGPTNTNQGFTQTAAGSNIDKSIKIHGTTGDNITFTQFTGTSTLVAGNGLTKSGNTIDVGTASSNRIVVNADNIDLATVSRSDTGSVATTNFVQSVTSDSYGRLTGITLSTVPGVIIGSTTIPLDGSATTTIAGLTSVTSTGFTGALTGNASTATNLASGTTTLASNVVNSSLTSVGTLVNLTVTNPISGGVTGNAGTVTNGVYTNAANTFTAGPQTINIDAIGNKGVVIKGAASQTANLQEWQSTYTTTVSAAGTTTVTGTGFLPAMLNGTLTVSGTSYTITGYTSSTSITINTAATFTSVSGTIIYASTLLNNNGVLWINGGSSSTAVDTITDVATLIPTDKFHQFSSSTTLGGAQRRLIGYVSTTSNIDIGQTSTGITRGINLKPGNGNQSSFVTGAQGYHSFFPPNYFSGAGISTTENGYLGATEVLASGTWTSTGWTAGTGITITNVSNTAGSSVIYTTGSTPHGFVKDQTAIIIGFNNNTGFNTTGAQIIAVPSNTQFTIANSTSTASQPNPYGSVTSYAYTRSSGAAALSNSTTVSTSNYYQVTYTITGTNTTDQVTISLGGLSTTITTINGTTSGTWGPKPTATTGLSVDTTTNWTGTINISIRTISQSTPVYQILDSTGNSAFEIRTSPTALTGGTGSIRNLFIGRLAGSRAVYNGTASVATTSALWSTGIGDGALANLTTGNGNTAIGNNSGGSITTGATNTAVGSFTLLNATTASLNTAIGYNSLGALTTGNAHVAVGASALASATTGGGNTGVGYSALNATTTGGTNTAIGQQAGQSNTTGTANMFIGYFSGNGVTTGSQNVFVGREAGSTAIGQVNAVSNSIAIGYQTSTGASNQVVIGNTSITETRLQAPTVYGTNISLNALAAPTISSTSTAATGGTLAQNTTYYYVMTSINAAGVETVQGTEQSRLTGNTTATNTITLNWAIVPGATSYRIYRSTTSGSYASASYYAIAANYTITYTDTNATATGTATPPTAPVGSKTIFKPWVGQPTANTAGKLTEWQDSSGNTTAWIDPQGRLYFGSSSAGTLISGVSGTARFYATSDAVVTTVRANSTQTTNLQEWQNVGGTTLAAIGAAGALQLPYVADPGSITLTTAHYTVNYTTGTFTATLPAATTTAAAAGVTGRIYNIKNSGAGTITIAASGSDLIDGLATKTLSLQYSSLTVQSTGSGWIVIN